MSILAVRPRNNFARTVELGLLLPLAGWHGLDLAIHSFAALIPVIVIALALSVVPVGRSYSSSQTGKFPGDRRKSLNRA
jgi:hypothetical protein